MMRSILYLSVNPVETRVAQREDGRLVAYRTERLRMSSVVGNLYKGRVTSVLPGMQAAFVDVGLNRDAFLYVREAGGILDEFSEIFSPPEGENDLLNLGSSTIDDLLQPGQEVLVQIVKDPLGSKGARLTTYISLPGRFLVYLPTTNQLGVSRRIADEEERERLREIIGTFDQPGGWIVRTAGENQKAEDLKADGRALPALWRRVQNTAEKIPAPGLIHQELSPILRTVRDMFARTIDECWIDDEEAFQEVLTFLERSDPVLIPKVKLFRHSRDLMIAHGIDRELEKALRPKVWLKSGGNLVVNQTEALVAIDVNTGKYVGSTDLEDTAFHINQEAVREIARQLRLRDLGGIIVIDFIDMEVQDHREALYSSLEEELRLDPARTQLVPMSELGLIQLTRKRTRPSLDRTLSRPCPHCHGTGRIKSLPTVCLEIRRQLLDLSQTNQLEQISLMVHPEVSHYLQGPFRDLLRELEEVHGLEVILRENPLFHQEQYEVD
ncbi:MAG: Rne/Rng family ribonuclease [Acidobacteria bacterium]|nr:MAG: Rne/Rng family ribonuclease [Acidobacteriota bacterium]RLE28541.1 MAG: Rne/Rng family ribonuclease [Acidobacteriota bacterium]